MRQLKEDRKTSHKVHFYSYATHSAVGLGSIETLFVRSTYLSSPHLFEQPFDGDKLKITPLLDFLYSALPLVRDRL